MSPLLTQDDVPLMEPVEVMSITEVVTPQAMSGNPGSSSLLRHEVVKKRKFGEEYTPSIEAMDMDEFEFDKVILKDSVLFDTSVMYFSDRIFGRKDLKRNLFQHFGTNIERSQIRATHRRDEA